MSQYVQYLVIIGALAQLIGIASYIKETLQGKTKPNKVTWLLWSVAPLIAAIAAFTDGVRWAILPTFMAGFGPLLVFICSFISKNAYWKLEKFDYICGIFSILALILWAITKQPIIAIIFSIASDGLAAVPTLIKAWKYPDTENAAPYITGIFSALTSFAAITMWNFSSLAFPIYLVLLNTCIIISIYNKKLFKNI